MAAGVGILGVDGAREGVQDAHEEVLHVLVEGGILKEDRALVADVVEQFEIDGVELGGIVFIDGDAGCPGGGGRAPGARRRSA